jgi:hypothetical protein
LGRKAAVNLAIRRNSLIFKKDWRDKDSNPGPLAQTPDFESGNSAALPLLYAIEILLIFPKGDHDRLFQSTTYGTILRYKHEGNMIR